MKERQITARDSSQRGRRASILVVDDDEGMRFQLDLILSRLQESDEIEYSVVDSIEAGLSYLCQHETDVVVLDKRFAREGRRDECGIEAIPAYLQARHNAQIIVYSASEDTQDVVRAMTLGASGFVKKDESEELLVAQIRKAIMVSQLTRRNARLERSITDSPSEDLVFASRCMKQIRAKLPAFAESDRPVLLLGETGTGKTAIGKMIHRMRHEFLESDSENFQYFNVRAFQPNVVESELFGHEPGAFTGATQRKLGFCEIANNGTLFIDEIGEAPLDLQAKLLTVLSEGMFHRVGGIKPIHSSFKLICATNRDLRAMVEEGTFREDLYYRICALELPIPPLMERREDIPALVRNLLPKMSDKNRVPVYFEELPEAYLDHLIAFPPKGNIRGLENALTRLLVGTPKDRNGRCIFTDWENIHNPTDADRRAFEHRTTLSIADLVSLPINLDLEQFPGLDSVLEAVENKIVVAAWEKLGKGKDIATFLKRAPSSVSVKYRNLIGRQAREGRPIRSKKTGTTEQVL